MYICPSSCAEKGQQKRERQNEKTKKNVLGLQEKFLTKYEKTEVRKKHVKSIKMDNHSVKANFDLPKRKC